MTRLLLIVRNVCGVLISYSYHCDRAPTKHVHEVNNVTQLYLCSEMSPIYPQISDSIYITKFFNEIEPEI